MSTCVFVCGGGEGAQFTNNLSNENDPNSNFYQQTHKHTHIYVHTCSQVKQDTHKEHTDLSDSSFNKHLAEKPEHNVGLYHVM